MADRKNKSPKKVSGGTVFDYLVWRGDLTFENSPWIEIDSVIAAIAAYANLGENEVVFGSGKTVKLADLAQTDLLERYPQEGIGDDAQIRSQFLKDLGRSRRFQDVTVLDQVNDVDPERSIQFSAMTLDVPGVGTVIAFRGTDPSLVGWKEDFMMSYTTPVPAQTAALAYLKKAAEHTEGPLYLTGHSKGGNLALYSAAHADRDVQKRLAMVYSFDGPGLDDETIHSEGYRRIEPLIRSFIPSDSIVGMLMNYYPKYRVVQSESFSILQHDPFNWKLAGRHFLTAKRVSKGSRILDQAVHEWLKSCTAEQREVVVTAIFSALARKQLRGGADEDDSLLQQVDEDAKKMVQTLINRLIAIHAGITWDTNVLKPLARASERIRVKLKGLQGLVKSRVIRIDNQGNGFREASDETIRMADDGGLSREECLRLALFTEEILSMTSRIAGDIKADFWIERVSRQYELHLLTRTVLARKQRRWIKRALIAKKTKKNGGFLSKLRGAIGSGEASGPARVYSALPGGREKQTAGKWRGYERSILFRLADDVQISIIGGEVRITVRKDFEE